MQIISPLQDALVQGVQLVGLALEFSLRLEKQRALFLRCFGLCGSRTCFLDHAAATLAPGGRWGAGVDGHRNTVEERQVPLADSHPLQS